MREFDSETVRKIWQRVQADRPVTPSVGEKGSLSEWIGLELMFADLYRRIAGKMSVRTASALRQLAYQEQQHARQLKGICVMTEGSAPKIHPVPLQKAPVSVLLRQCYGEKLRLMAEYEKRVTDGQFGSAFQRMLQQEQVQCRFILQLIGTEREIR